MKEKNNIISKNFGIYYVILLLLLFSTLISYIHIFNYFLVNNMILFFIRCNKIVVVQDNAWFIKLHLK